MAVVVLPTRFDGAQHYLFRSQLGARVYVIELTWNARSAGWSLALVDAAGNQLLNRRVTVRVPLLTRFTDPRLPYGELLAVDTDGSGADPGLTELGPGRRVQLVFEAAADLAGLRA